MNSKDEEGNVVSDYEMIIVTEVDPNEVVFVKIV